jgi:hypothetical protein
LFKLFPWRPPSAKRSGLYQKKVYYDDNSHKEAAKHMHEMEREQLKEGQEYYKEKYDD